MSKLVHLIPSTFARVAAAEWLRSAIGAAFGIVLTGVITALFVGQSSGLLVLMAPIGASAVLLFAVPASPLARPWAILGGNVISALVGVTVAHVTPSLIFAAGLAVGTAIAAMSLLRCLHPPGGAVALTAVVGGAEVADLGYLFALVPVLLNSALLAGAAIIYNRSIGRSYPHRAHAPAHPHPPERRIVLTDEDFDAVLADYGETLDIGRRDLEMLYLELVGRAEKAAARPARPSAPGRPPSN